jgi:hypothetical protein
MRLHLLVGMQDGYTGGRKTQISFDAGEHRAEARWLAVGGEIPLRPALEQEVLSSCACCP